VFCKFSFIVQEINITSVFNRNWWTVYACNPTHAAV